jgi:hypothetical protein
VTRGAILAVMLISACSAPKGVVTGPVRITHLPLTYSDGWPAKRAAEQICQDQNRRLNPVGFGRYDAGVWVFDGGCI